MRGCAMFQTVVTGSDAVIAASAPPAAGLGDDEGDAVEGAAVRWSWSLRSASARTDVANGARHRRPRLIFRPHREPTHPAAHRVTGRAPRPRTAASSR